MWYTRSNSACNSQITSCRVHLCVINSANGYDCVTHTNSAGSSQYEINSCRVYLCVTKHCNCRRLCDTHEVTALATVNIRPTAAEYNWRYLCGTHKVTVFAVVKMTYLALWHCKLSHHCHTHFRYYMSSCLHHYAECPLSGRSHLCLSVKQR